MRARLSLIVLTLLITAQPVRGFRLQAEQSADDGRRELTLTGCLLRSGYAGYQIDDAKLEAIDGKPVAKDGPATDGPAKAGPHVPPKKWILDGGGNLGASTGRKVQVVGRSDWRAEASADDPPTRTLHLEVMSVTTIAPACS